MTWFGSEPNHEGLTQHCTTGDEDYVLRACGDCEDPCYAEDLTGYCPWCGPLCADCAREHASREDPHADPDEDDQAWHERITEREDDIQW